VDLVLYDDGDFRSRWESGFVVQSAGEQGESLGGMLRAFRLNMQALSLMALFVGVFLVYNTATFAVVSRRRDAGILMSLGARRGEIIAAFLAEVSLVGAVGGLCGGTLGYLLSRALSGVVGQTVSNLYFALTPADMGWSWGYPAMGLLLGTGASLLGSLWPLSEVVSVDAATALHGRVSSSSSGRTALRIAALGGAVMAASTLLALPPSLGVGGGFVAAFGFLGGASLCGGLGVLLAAPLLAGGAGALFGLTGRLAAGVLRRNLGRTSVAASAFTVALALTIGMGSMIGSFRSSLLGWMEGQLQGEMYVGSSPEVTVPDDLYEKILLLDGVADIDRYRNEPGFFRGQAIRVAAVDADVLKRHSRFRWLEGGNEHWTAVREGAVIVSESFAVRFGIGAGGTVALEGRAGEESLPVEAVFTDYTTEHGLVMMDRSTYERLFEDRETDTLGIFFGTIAPEGLEETIAAVAADRGLPSWTRQEFVDRVLVVFDSTFALTRAMRALAIIIALFGISGALLTLFMERRREFGIYRALGFSVQQAAGMALLEGILLGLVSFALSVPAGSVLALLLIKVINVRSFNWTIDYAFAAEPYALAAITALAAGAAASLYPAWKLWQTYPHLQLREE
jgi:putative ABC transport system permease protein